MPISWQERFDLCTVEEVLTRRWERVLLNTRRKTPSPLLKNLAANLSFLAIPDLTVRTISIAQLSNGPDLRLHCEFWRALSEKLIDEVLKLTDNQMVLTDTGQISFINVTVVTQRLIGERFESFNCFDYQKQSDDYKAGIGELLAKNLSVPMIADLAYTWQRPDAEHYFLPLMDLMAAGNWPLGFIEPNVLLVLTS